MERIDLTRINGVVRVRAWATEAPASWRYAEVAVGTIPAKGWPDGVRWWASRTGQRWSGTWLADSERQACHAVDVWMRRRGGEWRPTPASFGGDGLPADGREWVRSGGTWLVANRLEETPVEQRTQIEYLTGSVDQRTGQGRVTVQGAPPMGDGPERREWARTVVARETGLPVEAIKLLAIHVAPEGELSNANDYTALGPGER